MNSQKQRQTSAQRMTLKEYLQLKNLKRNMEFKLLNYHQGIPNSLSQQKQMEFQANINYIKQYIKDIIGDGSLFSKFNVMIDNLYALFRKQIEVYHKLRFERQTNTQNNRFSQFRKANQKINDYLKTCQQSDKKVGQRLQDMQRAKSMFRKERQQNILMKEKMKKSAIQQQKMLKDNQAPQRGNKINLGQNLKGPSIPQKNIGKLSNIFASIIGPHENQSQQSDHDQPMINIRPAKQIHKTLKDSSD